MNGDIDCNEIKQIKENVHKKQTEIYIPCLKTYGDLLGEENKFTPSTEIFFEFSAYHKSQYIELKQRENPVRIFRTAPIVEDLLDIANKEWEENKSDTIDSKINLVFSSTEPAIFDSVMPSMLSIFEKANVIKEECGKIAKITIISNYPDINNIKGTAEKEADKEFTDEDFIILNTDEWLMRKVEEGDEVVRDILINFLFIKGEIIVGDKIFKLSSK